MIEALPYYLKYAIGLALVAVAAGALWFGQQFLTAAWNEQHDQPTIVLRKVAYFWIESEQDIYQIGAVIRLFNLGGKPYLVNGVALNATEPLFYGRGGAHIQRLFLTGVHAEITDDNFIKPMNEASFRMLLPIKFQATIEHLPPPGISFVGQWALILQKVEYPLEPEYFGTFDRAISRADWAALLKPSSTISIDDISFEKTVHPDSKQTTVSDTLLYNPDRSATFHVFGFDQTPYARGDSGTIVYVRGKGTPPLDGGWIVLGHSYEEVWADTQKRRLYNTVFPPGPDGSPRPIAVFQ